MVILAYIKTNTTLLSGLSYDKDANVFIACFQICIWFMIRNKRMSLLKSVTLKTRVYDLFQIYKLKHQKHIAFVFSIKTCVCFSEGHVYSLVFPMLGVESDKRNNDFISIATGGSS